MSEKSFEERLAALEERVDRAEKKAQRAEDILEIQNLMGRYVWKHEAMKDPEFTDLYYAQNQDDVSWEVAQMGLFKGLDNIRIILNAHGPDSGTPKPGTMFLHTLCSPVIEIAGDRKSAKGVWHSPGAEATPDPKDGNLCGMWAWTKYAVDFIREGDEWKIWHYHVYRIFMTPAGTNFTDGLEDEVQGEAWDGGNPFGIAPNAPTTYDNPYNKDHVPGLVPAPPEKYETFSETFSYGEQLEN